MKRIILILATLILTLSSYFSLTAQVSDRIVGKDTNSRYIGELYGGGVVFWLDHTGQHGLIVSMVDLSTSQPWSNMWVTLIGPTAQSDWNGLDNSKAIVEQKGHTSSAAQICLNYTNEDYGTGVYSDWYLPGRNELNALWCNIKIVQNVLNTYGKPANPLIIGQSGYWSSTEVSAHSAYSFFIFLDGYGCYSIWKGNGIPFKTASVRAIRAF